MKEIAINKNGVPHTQMINAFIGVPSDTHETRVLKLMFQYEEITASQTNGISNANQYFPPLERLDIIKSRKDVKKRDLKWRSIKDIRKALDYIWRKDKSFGTRQDESFMKEYNGLMEQMRAEKVKA